MRRVTRRSSHRPRAPPVPVSPVPADQTLTEKFLTFAKYFVNDVPLVSAAAELESETGGAKAGCSPNRNPPLLPSSRRCCRRRRKSC